MKNPKLLTEIHAKLKSKGWEKVQASRAEKVISLIGNDMLVNQVNESHVEHLTETLLDKKLQPSTVNRYLASLSKMLTYAHKRQAIYNLDRIPFIEWLEENEGRERYLEPAEEQKMIQLLTDWKEESYLELYLFLLDSGMRLGEALSFKKSNVDNTHGNLVVNLKGSQTKNGHRRSIPLTHRATQIVESKLNDLQSQDNVFGHLDYWRAENLWRKLRKGMGLQEDKDFVIHSLRHTCATRLAQSGKIELHLVGQMLGHRSWAMIQRYAHLVPSNLMGAIDVLNKHTEQRIGVNGTGEADTYPLVK
nr:integrase [Methylophilales phage MEP433]WOZ55691.1 integrase [Methylophilales phage MEP434]